MPRLIVIAHNIRSTHNVGAIFRTSDGFGVEKVILSGYSPYPETEKDVRLPHIREKLSNQIHKSALGAELVVPFEHYDEPPLAHLRDEGWRIVALEQAEHSTPLPAYTPHEKTVLILGEEVAGIHPDLLAACDDIIEIPMKGAKESFNVSVAAGIALYQLAL